MQKNFYIIFLLLLISTINAGAQTNCCPDFELRTDRIICDTCERPRPKPGPIHENPEIKIYKKVACRNGVHEYFVVPGNISGFTYTWNITGGNIINATGSNLSNPLTTVQNYIRVKWGNTSEGLLTVYITNPDGSCRDTLIEQFCLVVGPNSNFSIDNPGTVCKNSPVSFTNNSTGGTEYFWDFGDGTYSNLQNPPPHSYSTPGIKTISLTVSKKCTTEYDGQYPTPQSNKYPCTSISYQTITVSDKEGLKIISDCNKMICLGEKVRYCAEGNCSSLIWQVIGGTIVGGPGNSNKKCIEVIWDSPPATGLPTITVTGNCGGGCGNTATLEVPVLYNNIPVTGNIKVCKSSQETYSLPVMAGTFYNWTITPFVPITGNSINTNTINVDWSSATEGNSYTIKCDYYNPLNGTSNSICSGSTSLVVVVKPKLMINGLTNFCTLTNQTFTLAPITTSPLATWSILPATGFTPPLPGTNVASITENWSVAGTYQISAVLAPASLPDFCTAAADIIVQVNPQPTVTINPANPVCAGTPTIYSAIPSIPGGTFNWSLGGGGTISTNYGDSILVVWAANTAHTISLTYTLNGCVATNTLNIPILTNGTPSGLQTVCMDAIETYQITGGNIPTGSYNWSISSGAAGGTILNGQGTNQVQILWHGITPIPNTRVETLSITTCAGVITWPVTVISSGTTIITVSGNLCTPAGATLTTNLPTATFCNWYKNGVLIPGNGTSLQIFSEGLYKVVPGGSAACFSPATINIPKEFNGVATIIANGPTTYGCVPFSLTINAFINNVPATSVLYDFTWYSYSAPNTNIPVGTNSPVLTVIIPGIYWVKICMKGSQCCSNSNMIQVIQMGCPGPGCTANATATITKSSCNPFNFSVTWNPGTVINTVWNFGDGTAAVSGTTASHNYEYAGSYWVTVSGCIPAGNGNCCAVFDKINYIVPFVPRFDTTYPACGSVKLINQTTFVPGPALTYTWTSTGVSTHTTDVSNNAIFTYAASGNYIVTLTVSDGICSQSYSLPVHVFLPTAVISGPDPVCEGSSASFITTTPALPNTYLYYWEFGDGFTSQLSQPQHIYSNPPPSPLQVKVTVTDQYGCKAIGIKPITVLPALVVNLTYTPDTLICPGSTVTFSTTTTNFQTYQWYQHDIAIPGANTNSYTTGVPGIYHVVVTGNNGICTAKSKIYHVFHKQKAVAVINTSSVACFNTSTNTATINLLANSTTFGPFTYKWQVLLKPSSSTVTIPNVNVQFATATVNATGMYQFEVTVTNTNSLCTAKDSICVYVTNAPTVAITSTAGLCAGVDNLLQTTNYPPVDLTHSYLWSNGISGQMTNAFNSGIYTITKIDKSSGCFVKSNALTILPTPSTILFPAGCDTICMNDTSAIMPPLPLQQGQTIAGVYNVKWLDNGVLLVPQPLTPGVPLPIASLTLGMHHLTAIVSFISGSNNCVDTSASYDVYIKDCIGDTCNKCVDILKSISIDDNVSVTGSDDYQLNHSTITFTILKPVREVRLSLDQLNYEWNDSTCYDCKLTSVETGCLFPANPNQPLGTLLWDNTTGSTIPPNANGTCTREIVWKNGTMLQPGTYTIPVQLTLPGSGKGKCKLILKNYCVRLTLLDDDCNRCESTICKDSDDEACNCNVENTWTSLTLTPRKTGVPKTPRPVLCNTTILGLSINSPYILSGVYNCQGKCPSIKNEITVYNQQNQLIYTNVSTALNETLVFPAPGIYSITVTATCGTKKCACSFRVEIPEPICIDCPIITDSDPPYPIDSVLTDILPPDFNGEILVAKNDTVLYEKYISYKDSVNSHTAFDLASITKTFTSMAILKLMEDGKLNIDDAVSKYIIEFPIQEITIKMLMSHKSGLEDYLNFMDGADWDKSKPMSNADLLQFIVNNKTRVLIGVPGKTFDYSNTNFALLSLIIEKISGQSYANYLSSVFFKPLQMNDTYVLGLENHARATKSYYKNGDVYKLRYLDMINGDKNVYSTVQDLRKWDKGLRNGKLFKKSTLDLAYAPSNPSVAYVSNYGLGWKKVVASNGNEVLYHTGWWAGSRSILIRLIKENVIIAVVSNNNFTNIAEIRKLVDLFGDFKLSNKKIPNF